MNSQKDVVDIKVSRQDKSKKPRQASKSKTNASKNKKKSNNRQSKSPRYNPLKDCYVRLLNDPFNNPPCRLGFGTMVPTITGTLVNRTTLSAASDGSLAVYVAPFLAQSPITINTSGSAGTTWSSLAYNNIGQYPSTVITEARIICIGLKVTPLVASTAAPGSCFVGQLAGQNQTFIDTLSTSSVSTFSSMRSLLTINNSVLVVSRPVDNSAYEFSVLTYTGSSTATFPHSAPTIALQGYPASASVLLEVTTHFEYIPMQTTTTERSFITDISPDQEKVSDFFPSLERLWDYTSSKLNPAAVLDVTTSALNLLTARSINRNIYNGGMNRRLN